MHLEPLKTADDKKELAARLSTLSAGFSGAALANVRRQAHSLKTCSYLHMQMYS